MRPTTRREVAAALATIPAQAVIPAAASSPTGATMSTQVTIIGRLRARPGREAELRAALLVVLEASRSEAGCLNYDLHVAESDPALFVLYENWASQAALDAHFAEPHSRALAARFDTLLAEPLAMERLTEISSPAHRRIGANP
jgi:quinol monooxygenase YgiN